YQYDAVGNMTQMIDGRGITTTYVYNQLNQLVQTTQAAAVPGVRTNEPLPLTAVQYLSRNFYDYNDNVVMTQVEDRGATSIAPGSPRASDLPNPTIAPGTSKTPSPPDSWLYLPGHRLPVRHFQPARRDAGPGDRWRQPRVPGHADALRPQRQPGP